MHKRMKKIILLPTVLLMIAGLSGLTLAAELGDTAPDLKIEEWVKGDAVEIKKGHVYVVEFWATWCPPCRESIPHLTELQKKHRGKATIIGISTEPAGTVEPFVKEKGAEMNYTVAVDKEQGASADYMESFDVNSIPHAFIVDQQKRIVWHGNPLSGDFDTTLEKVVAGKYDLEQAIAERKEREKQMKIANTYFESLVAGKEAQAKETGEGILEEYEDSPEFLNMVAWAILTHQALKDEQRDKALALKMAQRAVEKTESKDAQLLDTLALALYESGKVEQAVDKEKLAIKLAEDNDRLRQYLESRLEKYENALDKKKDE
ncbi:MAG: redoxin domain-containing protein [Candidatus Sumerlaeota bacterium]